MSSRSILDHLADLDMLGIITAEKYHKGRKGGTYKTYSLNHPSEVIVENLDVLDRVDKSQSQLTQELSKILENTQIEN